MKPAARRYDVLRSCEMNRDAHEIRAAALALIALIERFHERYDRNALRTVLRAAEALGPREPLSDDDAHMVRCLLEDTRGICWTLDTFADIFGNALYPLDREAVSRTGCEEYGRQARKPR